jgi:hypothetical protein
MKKNAALILLILCTTLAFSQKKEKIKGTKIITISQRETGDFDAIQAEDNLEIYLERGEKNEIRIEADENLHEIIQFDLRDKMLRLYTSKESSIFKKMVVHITYTNTLSKVIAKNESRVYAIQEIVLDDISFNSVDFSRLFLNVNSKKFNLVADDKSKAEINLKAEEANLQLSKNSTIKSLVSAVKFKCDLYQKSVATIEGLAEKGTVRIDNNTTFTGTKFTIKNVNFTAENYATGSVLAQDSITLSISDKAEVSLLGSPKIELSRFSEEAKLFKKIK